MRLPFVVRLGAQQPGAPLIFFRGDDRSPNVIFATGFKARTRGGPRYRYPHGTENPPDVDPDSAVCVSRDFAAAAIFPRRNPPEPTWVYVLDLSTRDVVNVQAIQYEHAVRHGDLSDPEHSLWPMYGQERLVKSVSPRNIVGAVLVNRRQAGALAQDEFQTTDSRMNPRCTEDARLRAWCLVVGFISQNKNEWKPLPTWRSGIVRSTQGRT